MTSTRGQTLIVVPTRNRADLARNAIRSVLEQREANVRLMVSDNSTSEAEIEKLSQHCRDLKDERVTYTRPPEPLPMPQHWEWVIKQALADASVSHVGYLTDRMIFKKGALKRLQEVIAAHPTRVISYNHDMVIDWERPIYLRQEAWTGKVVGVNSAELIALSARADFPHCMPRMVNSVTPREIYDHLRSRYGNVFTSVAPDYCFSYRCLAQEEMIVYIDEALLIHYALDRSNGHSMARGIKTTDYTDFVANMDNGFTLPRMPLPELLTGSNVMLNEYFFVKEESHSDKFPPLDEGAYFERLANEVELFADPEEKEAAKSLLAQHRAEQSSNGSGRSIPRKVIDKLRWETRGPATKPLWMMLAGALKIKPPGDQRFGFDTIDEAFDYAERYPRKRSRDFSIYPFKCTPLSGSSYESRRL
ncbi:MAG TPA: glycosyltransferase [Pyrinomonadaceae bacterium]|nr:glycosyltransferase [Pyrinomonadaceae bacterium]